MRTLIDQDLLARLGLDFETCRFTLTAKRAGDTVEVTTTPAFDAWHLSALAESIPPEALLEGVDYRAVIDDTNPEGTVTADGTDIPADGAASVIVANFLGLAKLGSEMVRYVRDTVSSIEDFEGWLPNASAQVYSRVAQLGLQDALRSGRRLVMSCAGCGTDRNKQEIPDGSVKFRMDGLTCGFAMFGILAQLIEETGAPILSEIELPQLRRLKLELEASGSDLVVTLPEGDQGEPWNGEVLTAYRPPRRASNPLEELFASGRAVVIDPSDPNSLAQLERIFGG